MSKKNKEVLYRCTNRNGPDGACEYAENGELIPASKVVEKDEDGNVLCPGQTVFGDPCGAVLEPAVGDGGEGKKVALIAAVVVVAAILGFAGWKWFPDGHAKLHLEPASLTLSPGESAKIELINEGDGTLKIIDVKVSPDAFSLESADKLPKVAPGEKGSLRIQLAPEVKDNVQGTLTLETNGTKDPVVITLAANVDPWSVFNRLNQNSKILKQE